MLMMNIHTNHRDEPAGPRSLEAMTHSEIVAMMAPADRLMYEQHCERTVKAGCSVMVIQT